MEPNQTQPTPVVTPPQHSGMNWIIIVVIILILGIAIFAYTKYMPEEKQTEVSNTAKIGYLEKSDSIYKLLSERVFIDLKEASMKADQNSSESKAVTEKLSKVTKETHGEVVQLFEKSIGEYMNKVEVKLPTSDGPAFFAQNFVDIGKEEITKLQNGYDIRIKGIGENEYVVEFWYDLVANSLPEYREMQQKAADDGSVPRYTKQLGLIYTVADNTPVFHNPFQEVNDFINKL